MPFFDSDKLLEDYEPDPAQQSVLVYIKLSDNELGSEEDDDEISELEKDLQAVIEARGLGEYDWHEYGGGEAVLFMYSKNADELYGFIEPVLLASPLAARITKIVKWYGPRGDKQVCFKLGEAVLH